MREEDKIVLYESASLPDREGKSLAALVALAPPMRGVTSHWGPHSAEGGDKPGWVLFQQNAG